MAGSDCYGVSDDEALLIAATQIGEDSFENGFENSPRPAKHPRVEGSFSMQSSDHESVDDDLLEDTEFFQDAEALEDNDIEAKKRRHLLHAPRVEANLDRIIITQTQIAPASQPWEIRGPVWKRPQIQAVSATNGIQQYFNHGHDHSPNPVAARVERTMPPPRLQALVSEDDRSEMTEADGYNPAQDLAELPSDAFQSSPTSPCNLPEVPMPRRVASMTGLRQTTLFGRNQATLPASQTNKRHNWPLANKDEPLPHHTIDLEAMKTWIYPTNIGKIRDYQFNIVHRGLFHNLLVALPTGLGKTFIAATIILNWYRWTRDAQIVFVAPTRPLVAQQVEACFNIAGIPRSQTTMLTGEVAAGLRAEEWKEKRVFFMTPQTLINDLKTGTCDPKRIVLLVIDEAHRATGGYAYVEVVKFVRRFNENFRVLALTATPGSDVEAVQKVIDGLDISRCEIRTEQSLDIREYVHQKDITKQVFDPTDEMELLFDMFSKAAQPMLDVVVSKAAFWVKDPLKLSRYGLLQASQKWMASAGRQANQMVKGMLRSAFSVLQTLAFALEMLKYYSIKGFYEKLLDMRKETRDGKTKSKYRKQVDESEAMERMMVRLKAWTCDPEFIGHPKLEQVRAEVMQHLIDAGEGANGGQRTSTRIEIFSQYRESVEEICRVLQKDQPIVRPHVFVGQSSSDKSEGMTQKKQLEVTTKFKNGDYNVLISTSVGEEGLDIGEVDLIICYDSKSSPIRLLQRMGRTGRKREGRVVWLQMKGKEQDDAIKAMDNYEKMQGLIASGDEFNFHHDRSRRMVPREIQPIVDKRVVDIPIENTQRTKSDFLPVPKKKGRVPKRPPKKFHMPDGVRAGFTTALRLDEDDEGADEIEAAADVPPLHDVFLFEIENVDLQRRYQSFPGDDDAEIRHPQLDKFPQLQRTASKAQLVPHGARSTAFVQTMARIASIDDRTVQRMEAAFDESFLSPDEIESVVIEDRRMKPVTKKPKNQIAAPRGRPIGSKNKVPKPQKAKSMKKQRRVMGSSDMEGEPSSEPNTSPQMAMRSQAISLGSDDTSGSEREEEEGYLDSDLEDFVVHDDRPLSEVDSSLPRSSAMFTKPRKKRNALMSQGSLVSSSQELPEFGDLLASTMVQSHGQSVVAASQMRARREQARTANKSKRRVVSDDEDDG